MKADNTVLEIADAVVPLFGDIDREYDFLQKLVSFKRIDGGIEAAVQSFESVSARVHLAFVTPEIVRVQRAEATRRKAALPLASVRS